MVTLVAFFYRRTLPSAGGCGHIAGMWYYEFNDQQIGPVPESELQARIAEGVIGKATLIWNETMLDWKPAGTTMPAAFTGVTAASPTASPAGYTDRSTRGPGSTGAKFAFALGVISIVVGILVGAIGLFLGAGAIFLGALMRNKGRRAGVPVHHHANLGMITGALGVAISIINIIGGYLWAKSQGLI